MKKLLPLLLLIALLLIGCSAPEEPQPPAAVDFTKAGLTITLTEEFTESAHVGYTAVYTSTDLAVMTLKEEYTLFENTDYSADTSPEEYAGLVWSANQMVEGMSLQTADGLSWFEYTNDINGSTYRYRAYVLKSADAFWLVQFSTFARNFDGMTDTIHSYAKTMAVDAQ